MPIEIIIRVSEEHEDYVILDGHYMQPKQNIKRSDILDMLEYLGYITIKIEE